jgi:SAM-dependent methyltransferase
VTTPSKLWGDADFTERLAELQWMASGAVLLHLNERATGDPAHDWLSTWAAQFFDGENLRVLVLGCGEGWLERALVVQRPNIARIDACDFAADAVARARAQAPPKIDYSVKDLNVDTLPPKTYDVIIAHAVLHHIERLEHAFDEIERALKDDGTLIVNEYAGPNRFQYDDTVLALINELLAALPKRFRRSSLTGAFYESKQRPTVEEMIANDPSEAVRSADLLPMIESRFDIIDRRNIGGAIAQHLLYDIVLNFPFDDSVARSAIEMICAFDGIATDKKIVPCDFVICSAGLRLAGPAASRAAAPRRPEDANPASRKLALLARRANNLYRPIFDTSMPKGESHPELLNLLQAMQRAILRAQ